MIRLEMETTRVVGLFTAAEQRREALVLNDFVAWQRSQHHNFPKLLHCFETGGGVDLLVAEASCPIQGLARDHGDEGELSPADANKDASAKGKGTGVGVAKLAMTGTWRTNLAHRIK